MKFTASSEKFLEERIPGVKVPPGHWAGGEKRRSLYLFKSFVNVLLMQIWMSVVYLIASLWREQTYCSRPWVGNLAIVLCPLVIMAMFVGKRSIEDIADISHRVHADG